MLIQVTALAALVLLLVLPECLLISHVAACPTRFSLRLFSAGTFRWKILLLLQCVVRLNGFCWRCQLHEQGMDAQRVKLTEVLAMSDPDAAPRSDVESAVLSQAIRIVFCALDAAGGRTIPPQSPPETQTPRTKPSR